MTQVVRMARTARLSIALRLGFPTVAPSGDLRSRSSRTPTATTLPATSTPPPTNRVAADCGLGRRRRLTCPRPDPTKLTRRPRQDRRHPRTQRPPPSTLHRPEPIIARPCLVRREHRVLSSSFGRVDRCLPPPYDRESLERDRRPRRRLAWTSRLSSRSVKPGLLDVEERGLVDQRLPLLEQLAVGLRELLLLAGTGRFLGREVGDVAYVIAGPD